MYYTEASYGKIALTGHLGGIEGDVFGWYTIPYDNYYNSTTPCNSGFWGGKAQQKAAQHGFVRANYDVVIHAFPKTTNCAWSGLGSVTGNVYINRSSTIEDIAAVAAHEVGHTLGLRTRAA